MPVDPLLAPLLEALNAIPRPAVIDLAERRAMAQAREGDPYAAFKDPVPEVADIRDEVIEVRTPPGEIRLRIYRSQRTVDHGAAGALVWYHGGGWCMGSIDDEGDGCRLLAGSLDLTVVSVDYRLAPEHPFPTPAEDAYDAAVWTAEHLRDLGVTGRWVGVAGSSAGGNLAAAVALLAKERGGPELALQYLEIPGLDMTLSSPSVATYGRGHVLDYDELVWCVHNYLGDAGEPKDPIASPVWASDATGLPPAIIFTAECDPLADDGRRYAELLRSAGVPVDFEEFPGQLHGSQGLTALVPTARRWRERMLESIGVHLTASVS